MIFDIKDYPSKYVMHCKTEEEAESFCEYLHSVGRKWCNGDNYLGCTEYSRYKSNTCYNFNDNCFGSLERYAGNYTILEWSDFMKNTFTKANLKNGDVIKRRNGWVEIVCLETGTCISLDGFNTLSDIRDDLTDKMGGEFDIIAVRRPTEPQHCQFCAFEYNKGELVYERKEPKFEVGDTVKVINTGLQYTTYREWVKTHIENEYDMFAYDIDHNADTSHTFKVMAIHEHTRWKEHNLAYIKDIKTDRCYLINIKGLERVS